MSSVNAVGGRLRCGVRRASNKIGAAPTSRSGAAPSASSVMVSYMEQRRRAVKSEPGGTFTKNGAGGMNKKKIEELFRRFERFAPEPEGELDFINPFPLLVAVVLSAQATDASVNKATEPLFKIADTPEKMLKLGEAKLKDYIKTIGLYNMKAKNVIALSRILIEQFGGKIPENRETLQTLPGVGRKTANVVLNIAFGQSTIAVDTH